MLVSSGEAAPPAVSYHKHIQPLFSRLGCNGGTCHGAVQGQHGFRLSLFGADPQRDHVRLLREAGGRRLNFLDPQASLLLQKATARLPHQGGKRLGVDNAEYALLRDWIAAGAPLDEAASTQVRALVIEPRERVARVDDAFRLRVQARFADGSSEDVSGLCSFESLEPRIAGVNAAGQVEARAVGDTVVLVRYGSATGLASVLVARTARVPAPTVKPHNFIDEHVLAKLDRLALPAAELCDDATFLRRVSLDVAGSLPTPAEVRAFLADASADKRARKIDELLRRPGHAALWTLKFCDLLKASDWGEFGVRINTEADAPRFQAWVRARLDENLPYDQFAERILTATSRAGRSLEAYARELVAIEAGYTSARGDLDLYQQRQTLDLYWQRNHAHGVQAALQVAHAFLGLRLECAQCHRHPSDVWQQDDLLSFANFFMSVRKVGFNTQNPKLFPELNDLSKQLEEEGKLLAMQVKLLRELHLKQVEAELKNDKDSAYLKQQQGKLRDEIAARERLSQAMPAAASRLLHHEVHIQRGKVPWASVTSPLGTQSSQVHRLPGAKEAVHVPPGSDPRQLVADWLRRPDNPYFARAIVNRVWAHYFGRGLVDPSDNLSPFSPPSHPALLQELSDGFVKNRFDLRWLHRTILASRTYQQSSVPTKGSELDRANYAFFARRRLSAEVLLDALDDATQTREPMNMEKEHWQASWRHVELPYPPKNAYVAFMLDNFGKPKRNAAVQCDCERDGGTTMLQVLGLANHPRLWAKVQDANGRAARIVKNIPEDERRIDELYLSTLSRLPTVKERAACLDYLRGARSPAAGCQGILWGLLNTREFLLQH